MNEPVESTGPLRFFLEGETQAGDGFVTNTDRTHKRRTSSVSPMALHSLSCTAAVRADSHHNKLWGRCRGGILHILMLRIYNLFFWLVFLVGYTNCLKSHLFLGMMLAGQFFNHGQEAEMCYLVHY